MDKMTLKATNHCLGSYQRGCSLMGVFDSEEDWRRGMEKAG